jgi:hypothetical protein
LTLDVVQGEEDKMQKAFEANDGGAQEHERSQKPGEELNLRGKAFQVNENSVEEGEPIRPSVPPDSIDDENDGQKLRGKSFQVNENSVEEGELIRPESRLERR